MLARVLFEDREMLVAASVLPWQGATDNVWGRLTGRYVEDSQSVLDHHVARIAEARKDSEPLIWGGDLNQPLVPPFTGGSEPAARRILSALGDLGLTLLTQGMAHRGRTMTSVDHIAVSHHFSATRTQAHRPTTASGKVMSDHDAYTADLRLLSL